jgi:hypothetical protein
MAKKTFVAIHKFKIQRCRGFMDVSAITKTTAMRCWELEKLNLILATDQAAQKGLTFQN